MKPIAARWKKFILHLMGKEDPPEKVAAAFALGVGISFLTPLTGFHTIIALALAFLLGLSKVDIVMGTLVINPWTMVPVITAEQWLGKIVLHLSPSLVPRLPWRKVLHKDFWHTVKAGGWNLLAALTVGSVILGLIAASITYFFVRGLIRRYERLHPHLSARLKKTGEFPVVKIPPEENKVPLTQPRQKIRNP